MDKIYYLCDRAVNALLRYSSLLSDYFLFGFLENEVTEGVDDELKEVFGVTNDYFKNEFLNISENERYFCLFYSCYFCSLSHTFSIT